MPSVPSTIPLYVWQLLNETSGLAPDAIPWFCCAELRACGLGYASGTALKLLQDVRGQGCFQDRKGGFHSTDMLVPIVSAETQNL